MYYNAITFLRNCGAKGSCLAQERKWLNFKPSKINLVIFVGCSLLSWIETQIINPTCCVLVLGRECVVCKGTKASSWQNKRAKARMFHPRSQRKDWPTSCGCKGVHVATQRRKRYLKTTLVVRQDMPFNIGKRRERKARGGLAPRRRAEPFKSR